MNELVNSDLIIVDKINVLNKYDWGLNNIM